MLCWFCRDQEPHGDCGCDITNLRRPLAPATEEGLQEAGHAVSPEEFESYEATGEGRLETS